MVIPVTKASLCILAMLAKLWWQQRWCQSEGVSGRVDTLADSGRGSMEPERWAILLPSTETLKFVDVFHQSLGWIPQCLLQMSKSPYYLPRNVKRGVKVELRGWQLICHSSPRKSQVIAQDKTSPQNSEITGRVTELKRNGLDMSTECAYKVIWQVNTIWEQGKQVEGVNLLMLNKYRCSTVPDQVVQWLHNWARP